MRTHLPRTFLIICMLGALLFAAGCIEQAVPAQMANDVAAADPHNGCVEGNTLDSAIAGFARDENAEESREARKVACGVLDASGDEMLVVVFSLEGFYGGNLWRQYLAVFRVEATNSLSLATKTVIGGKNYQTVESMRIESNTILLDTMENIPTDASCCPSRPGTMQFAFVNGRLVSDQLNDPAQLSAKTANIEPSGTLDAKGTFVPVEIKCKDAKDALAKGLCREVLRSNRDLLEDFEMTYAAVDLNGDEVSEFVVWESSWAGTSGGSLRIIERRGNRYKERFETQWAWTPILLLPTKHNGWRDIAFLQTGGGLPTTYVGIFNNGKAYTTIDAPELTKDRPAGEIIIDANWQPSLFGPQ